MVAKGRSAKGETHSQSKLTNQDVADIINKPNATQDSLAKRFGVSCSVISLIRRGKLWTHIQGSSPGFDNKGVTTSGNEQTE